MLVKKLLLQIGVNKYSQDTWKHKLMPNQLIKKYPTGKEFFFTEGCYITELLNSASEPELSIARARVKKGDSTKWHVLENIVERYVILEGSGAVEIGNANASEVAAGDVVVIPAGVRQRIHNNGPSDLIFLAICTPRFNLAAYQDLEAE